MKPLYQQKEMARLREVAAYKDLQEPGRERLQALVNIAATHFSVPIVYISLIDEYKQVLMVKKGIILDEMRIEDTFCHHVINNGTPLIINDTTKDSNFNSNPLVEKYPHIRFYAGAPLLSRNGFVLGAFCICDTKFRAFSFNDEKNLVGFSKLATEIIERNKQVENKDTPEQFFRYAEEEIPNNLIYLRDKSRNSNYHKKQKVNQHKFSPNHDALNNNPSTPKSNNMYPVPQPQHSGNLSVLYKSKMSEWGEMMIGSYRRQVSEMFFSMLAEEASAEMAETLQSKGNRIKWDITEPGGWYGDRTALMFVCNSILQNIAGRNKNATIHVSTFNDEDYAIMVIRHDGTPLLRSELDDAFKSPLHNMDPGNKEELYFIWHTLRLIGGFMTVPVSAKEGNYVTVGLPKKQLNRKYASIENYC